MRKLALGVLTMVALMLVGACKKSGLDACGTSVKECIGKTDCHAEFQCQDGKRLKLACKSASPAKIGDRIDCECIESTVVGKTVQVQATAWGLDEARATASAACGWPR